MKRLTCPIDYILSLIISYTYKTTTRKFVVTCVNALDEI